MNTSDTLACVAALIVPRIVRKALRPERTRPASGAADAPAADAPTQGGASQRAPADGKPRTTIGAGGSGSDVSDLLAKDRRGGSVCTQPANDPENRSAARWLA